MSGRWWKGNECRGVAILFHLFWLQTVGNCRLSKASHHLFLFLNMSVPQSVKLGHFLFGFQQKEGFDCSDISFPAIANVPCLNFNSLPAFYLFIFILSPVPSSFFLAKNQHICDFNSHEPDFTKPNILLPRNESSWVVSILLWLRTFLNPRPFGADKRWAGCFPRSRVSTSCSLVSVHAEMTQHSGRTPNQTALRQNESARGRRDKQQSVDCYCTKEETTYWQKQRSRIE